MVFGLTLIETGEGVLPWPKLMVDKTIGLFMFKALYCAFLVQTPRLDNFYNASEQPL